MMKQKLKNVFFEIYKKYDFMNENVFNELYENSMQYVKFENNYQIYSYHTLLYICNIVESCDDEFEIKFNDEIIDYLCKNLQKNSNYSYNEIYNQIIELYKNSFSFDNFDYDFENYEMNNISINEFCDIF